MHPDITYSQDVASLETAALEGGFFVGWPAPPSSAKHLAVLRGSYRAIVALDGDGVVGFVTAVSDGVATSFIPWLEVLPAYQGRGIGRELLGRMVAELGHLYSIDLVCDDDVVPFYDGLGWHRASAMLKRNPGAL
jgi:GNAT superfamily N-acetyltransferase